MKYRTRIVVCAGAAVLLAFSTGTAQAALIADFTADYQSPTPKPGWSYLWNQNGAIGTQASYSPMVYNANQGLYSSDGGDIPRPDPAAYVLVASGSVHPGDGTTQNAIERYSVTAFTLPSAATGVTIDNLSVSPNNTSGTGDGINLFVNVNSQPAVLTHAVAQGATYTPGTISLGDLPAGSTIYVAVGAGANYFFDGTLLQYQISSPVPEPSAIVLFGLAGAGLFFFRRTGVR